MTHSFVAYIDESGDQGFVFRENPYGGSSRWFVLSAVIVRREDDKLVVPLARSIRQSFNMEDRAILHFADMVHDRRVAYVHTIAATPFATVISVLVNEQGLARPEVFDGAGFRLYFYTTRILLERISWFARDYQPPAAASALAFPRSGPVKLIFEKCKNLNYESLRSYIAYLRTMPSNSPFEDLAPGIVQIHWSCINAGLIEIGDKKKTAGLQFADCVASSLKLALERSTYGYTEHRHAKTPKPRIYVRGANFTSYGLKFFPRAPNIHWVRKYYNG